MNLQKISYQVTITETNETHNLIANDVIQMMGELMVNIDLATEVFGRKLNIVPNVDPVTDELTINVNWADDGTSYMKVVANKIPDLVN